MSGNLNREQIEPFLRLSAYVEPQDCKPPKLPVLKLTAIMNGLLTQAPKAF